MKKYKIVYPLATAIPAIAMLLLSLFALKFNLFYSACFAALAGATGFLLARVVMLNMVDSKNDPRTWQVNIYCAVAIGGWVGAIFAQTWGWTSVCLCMVCCGLLLALGTKYLKDEDHNGIPDIFEKQREVKEEVSKGYMYEHMLFKLKGDKLGGQADHNRPLCASGNTAMTVREAIDKGLDSIAAEGIDYIDTLFNKTTEEENA